MSAAVSPNSTMCTVNESKFIPSTPHVRQKYSTSTTTNSTSLHSCTKKLQVLKVGLKYQFTLTKRWISQLSAYNLSFFPCPCIVAYSTPRVVIADFNSSTGACETITQTNISIFAKLSGIVRNCIKTVIQLNLNTYVSTMYTYLGTPPQSPYYVHSCSMVAIQQSADNPLHWIQFHYTKVHQTVHVQLRHQSKIHCMLLLLS